MGLRGKAGARWLFSLAAIAVLVACSGDHAADGSLTADTTFCDCANYPITSGDKARFCTDLMKTMSKEDVVTQTTSCRRSMPVPDGGPDVCFCLRTMTEDPELHATCEALVEKEVDKHGLEKVLLSCSR